MKRRKIVISCDSQSLGAYQRCPESFNYGHIKNLESVTIKRAFERGSYISRSLEIWYKCRRRAEKGHATTFTKLTTVEKAIIGKTLETQFMDVEDSTLLARKFKQYFNYYRNEHWRVVGTEVGFSKVLYENDYVKFLYEGRPDLIVKPYPHPDNRMIPVDHKSEGRKAQLFPLRNQFIGYAWALGTNNLIVNYFGLQETLEPKDAFHRDMCSYSKDQIDQWVSDTTKWYFKILASIVNRRFDRSWQCEGKYGLCQYAPLCSQPNDFFRADQIKRNFQERQKVWRAW